MGKLKVKAEMRYTMQPLIERKQSWLCCYQIKQTSGQRELLETESPQEDKGIINIYAPKS